MAGVVFTTNHTQNRLIVSGVAKIRKFRDATKYLLTIRNR